MRFNWNLVVTMEKVDVDKLEREMLDALRADRKYSRENDAKFRAVNQRVQTYEEFRCVHRGHGGGFIQYDVSTRAVMIPIWA